MFNVVFNFLISGLWKKVLLFKNALFLSFLKLNNFFFSSYIEILETILHSKHSLLYSVNISLLSLDYRVSGSYLRKTVFGMFYICKTNTTHAGVASS